MTTQSSDAKIIVISYNDHIKQHPNVIKELLRQYKSKYNTSTNISEYTPPEVCLDISKYTNDIYIVMTKYLKYDRKSSMTKTYWFSLDQNDNLCVEIEFIDSEGHYDKDLIYTCTIDDVYNQFLKTQNSCPSPTHTITQMCESVFPCAYDPDNPSFDGYAKDMPYDFNSDDEEQEDDTLTSIDAGEVQLPLDTPVFKYTSRTMHMEMCSWGTGYNPYPGLAHICSSCGMNMKSGMCWNYSDLRECEKCLTRFT
jgi:hypothetical protein